MNLWPNPRYPKVQQFSNPELTRDLIVIGGPCSWESEEQIDLIFNRIVPNVDFVRGGVFRAGTYPPKPEDWGWKMNLLKLVHHKCRQAQKPNVVDVLDIRDLNKINPYTEIFQVGMRQAQHYALLRELGKQKKPIILKRGSWMTYDETMGALEYILEGGNTNVFLCERGSVSNHQHVRWELSIPMIVQIKQQTGISVIVDAAHGSGKASLVIPLTLAGIVAGADGILVETHPNPKESLSDANQALSFKEFHDLLPRAKVVYHLSRTDHLK